MATRVGSSVSFNAKWEGKNVTLKGRVTKIEPKWVYVKASVFDSKKKKYIDRVFKTPANLYPDIPSSPQELTPGIEPFSGKPSSVPEDRVAYLRRINQMSAREWRKHNKRGTL